MHDTEEIPGMDLTGKTIDSRYRVKEYLGSSGITQDYKVWDEQRQIALVMRVLPEKLATDKIFLRRFQREAEQLAELQHPNLVQFYGLEQAGRLAFMLTEFIEGESLKLKIFDAGVPFSPQQVQEILRPVMSALQYLHKQRIQHGSINPEEIIISRQAQVNLAGLDMARLAEASTITLEAIHNPAYLAPEQARRMDDLTIQTDIYALGVILFELLSGGERPFAGEQAEIKGDITEKILWEQIFLEPPSLRILNPEVTSAVENVILKCLEKNPTDRYQNPSKLWQALESAFAVREDQKKQNETDQISKHEKEVTPTDTADTAIDLSAQNGDGEIQKSLDSIPKRKQLRKYWMLILLVLLIGVSVALGDSRKNEIATLLRLYTPTSTSSPTYTPTKTATITPSPTHTITPTNTSTPSPTRTSIPTKTPIPSSAVLYSDDFTNFSLSNWYISWGKWESTDGVLYGENESSVFAKNFNGENYTIAITNANLSKGDGFGIWFRVKNYIRPEGYIFQFDPGYGSGAFLFRKWVNGQELSTPIAISYASGYDWYGEDHQIQISVIGDTFIAYVDGKEVVSVSDSTYIEGTIGFRTWDNSRATFDDISILDPTTSALLLAEDFEDSEANDWRHGSEWVIVEDDDGNKYWRGTGPEQYPSAWYGDADTPWANYAFESRIRFVDGTIFICLRAYPGKAAFYTVYIDSNSKWIDFAEYENETIGWQSMQVGLTRGLEKNRWYLVRLEIIDDSLSFYINDRLVLSEQVSEPLVSSHGGVGFYMGQGEEIHIDDVRVWSLEP